MIEVATQKTLLSEVREETKKRFETNPSQFVIKQNTKEEAGSPFHIRMLMDEFANINQIPGFSEVLATIRKYNMSVAIILQSMPQLKKNYEKDYDPIIGNCDTFVFLGANSLETAKHVSEILGNMTVMVKNQNESLGKGSRSYGHGLGEQKRELMTPNEILQLRNDEQIVMVRAVYPMKIHKFKLENHPNFKKCADFDQSKRLAIQNWFDLKKKIDAINEKNGVYEEEESQAEINQKSQQTVDGWRNSTNNTTFGKGKGGNKNNEADEFFF